MNVARRRLVAVALVALATAMVIACDVLVLVHHLQHRPHGFDYWLEGSVSLPIWVAIGLVLVFRVPGNPLGWLAVGFGVVDGLQLFTGALATQLLDRGPSAVGNWLAVISTLAQMGVVGALLVFGLLVPDGRPVGRRWRPLVWAAAAAALAIGVVNAMTPSGVQDIVALAVPPVGPLSEPVAGALRAAPSAVIVVGMVAAVVGLVLRWRRGSAVERQQVKWVVYAAAVAVLLAGVVVPVGGVLWPHATLAPNIMWTIVPAVLPAATAVSILRYRLYDIDRIVSRTLSYAVLTGLLVGCYVGVVALTTDLFPFSSSLGVATSTLVAAALFQPLRRRVQSVVDHRFDRARYDAARTVEAFSARLRDQVDVDAVRGDLLGVVTRTVAPAHASVWVAP